MYEQLLPTIYKSIIEDKKSITQLSKEYGLNRNKVSKLLKEKYSYENQNAKFSRLSNKKNYDVIDKQAYELYNEGYNITAIAKELGVKRQNLSKRLKNKYNIEVLPDGAKYCNFEFFNEENELSCYWLGYIYADGSISKNSLEISSKDYDSIYNFKKDIESRHKIGEKIINGRLYHRISIKNSTITRRLKILNVIERKSFTDIDLPNINDNNFIYFLRGFIDGDGGYRVRKYYPIINMYIGFDNYNFCVLLKNKIKELYNCTCTIYTDKTCYRLYIVKKEENLKMINLLYKDSKRHLQRKYDLIKQFL